MRGDKNWTTVNEIEHQAWEKFGMGAAQAFVKFLTK